MSEAIETRIFGEGFLHEMLDHQEVERRLRSDLHAALGRLHRVRAELAAVSLDSDVAIDSFRTVAAERAAALREVERASLRFSEFILNGVIPQDLRSAAPACHSAANSRR